MSYTGTTLTCGQGYGGRKPWIARISGTDSKYGFDREFLSVRMSYSRSGKTGRGEAYITEPGLYQCRDTGQRGNEDRFYVILPDADGQLIEHTIDEDDALKLAALLDEHSIEQAARIVDGELRIGLAADDAPTLAGCIQQLEAAVGEAGGADSSDLARTVSEVLTQLRRLA